MSAEKRPADGDPGSSQMLVKRQNVTNPSGALARLNASSNALVQSVRLSFESRGFGADSSLGSTNERPSGAGDGTLWSLWGDFRGQV